MDYRTSLQTGNNNLAISQSVDQEALHNSRPSGVVSSEVAKLNGYSVSADAGNAKKVVSAGEGAATAVAAASIHDYQVDPVHCEKQLFNDDDTILLYPARNFELKLDFTGIKDSLEWVKTGHHFPDIEKKLPRDVVAFLNIATHRKDGKRLKSSPCLDNPCLDNMLISFSPEDYQPIGRLHYSVSRNTGKKTNNNDSFSKYSCAMDEREKGIVGLWLVEWLKQNNQQDLSMDFGNPPIPCEYGMYKNGFIVMCSHSGNEVCKEEYEYNSEVGQCESFPVFYKYPPCSMVTRIETGYKHYKQISGKNDEEMRNILRSIWGFLDGDKATDFEIEMLQRKFNEIDSFFLKLGMNNLTIDKCYKELVSFFRKVSQSSSESGDEMNVSKDELARIANDEVNCIDCGSGGVFKEEDVMAIYPRAIESALRTF